MDHVLQKKEKHDEYVTKNKSLENFEVAALTQCQKTMSPGKTFGMDVIVSSSLR